VGLPSDPRTDPRQDDAPTDASAVDTAVAIARQVRGGTTTARRMVAQAVAAIDDADAQIGAFQVVRRERALIEADEVDRRADRSRLPLAGVPVAIKDNIPVTGEPMRGGTLGSDASPQTADHIVVRRLRDAGAVVVGLTRCPELCVFGATDSAFGVTRNPWNLRLTPGGSSGGSAAAVAAGLVPVAHGNDGMGSIRIPAACCGLVGFKPGLGVVPAGIGVSSWFDMAENGVLTTAVADAALLLSVMADRPELAHTGDPGSVRVAVSTRPPLAGVRVDPQWAAATTETADLLRQLGHRVAAADPPYGQALGVRGIVPALARAPIEALDWRDRGWFANLWSNATYAPFAAPWNLAGWPAMTVPAGLDATGMPLAVQLVGRPGSEKLLLDVAAQLERARPWPRLASVAQV
jgi:amidase